MAGEASRYVAPPNLPRVPIRFMRPVGDTFKDMQRHAQQSELYKIGDAILVWVNEGDFWMNFPVEFPQPSVSDEQPKAEDPKGLSGEAMPARSASAETPSSPAPDSGEVEKLIEGFQAWMTIEEAEFAKNNLRSALASYQKKVEEQAERIKELEDLFDLRHEADMRAIKEWQEVTGQTLTWPDHADLCVFLMTALSLEAQNKEAAEKRVEELTAERDEADHVLNEERERNLANVKTWVAQLQAGSDTIASLTTRLDSMKKALKSALYWGDRIRTVQKNLGQIAHEAASYAHCDDPSAWRDMKYIHELATEANDELEALSVSDVRREAGETVGLDPKDDSAVPAGQTPSPPPASEGDEVEGVIARLKLNAANTYARIKPQGFTGTIEDTTDWQAATLLTRLKQERDDYERLFAEIHQMRDHWQDEALRAHERAEALQAEGEKLRNELDALASSHRDLGRRLADMGEENTALQAENERLKEEIRRHERGEDEGYQTALQEIATLTARLDSMTKALEPFKRQADEWDVHDWMHDDVQIVCTLAAGQPTHITAGDFRRARAALNPKGESK